jgi:alanine dehydrogenase
VAAHACGQIVFTYFHFAADESLTRAVMQSGITAIAYETIRDARGRLPLLTPMSEVAGRMSIQEGAKFLERPFEGRGILLGGVPGVLPANVVILGGGIVGANAAKVAAGLGANVTILDINLDRLRYLDDVMPRNVTTLYSDRHNVLDSLARTDLLIGAVLIPGARAPHLVRREDLKRMPPRAVIIDVAIDQGGCVETSRPTTHSQPTFLVDDVLHYCVTNMPGAVGRTSTYALTNVTLPYVLELARKGFDRAIADNPGPAPGRQHPSWQGDESRRGCHVRPRMRADLRHTANHRGGTGGRGGGAAGAAAGAGMRAGGATAGGAGATGACQR